MNGVEKADNQKKSEAIYSIQSVITLTRRREKEWQGIKTTSQHTMTMNAAHPSIALECGVR